MRTKLFNFFLDNMTIDEAAESIRSLVTQGSPAYVVEVNTDVAVKAENDPELLSAITGSLLTLADGKPIIWVSRIYKKPLKERVAGSDLIPKMCGIAAENHWNVFLLGGAEGVAEAAAKNLQNTYPGISIVGTYAPPFGFESDQAELDKINYMIFDSDADLVIHVLDAPSRKNGLLKIIKNAGTPSLSAAAEQSIFLRGEYRDARNGWQITDWNGSTGLPENQRDCLNGTLSTIRKSYG